MAGLLSSLALTKREASSPKETGPENQGDLIARIHYGGNLICHARIGSGVIGSGNNTIGGKRTDVILEESRYAAEDQKDKATE